MTSREPAPEAGEPAPFCVIHGGDERDRLAAIARREAQWRRRRNSLIRYDFFAEPAWDMLLELYIHRHGGRSVDAARLCAATLAGPTTALRWIGLLIDEGLVARSRAEPGNCDMQIMLSERGTEEMERYLRDRLSNAQAGRGMAEGIESN